MDASLLLLVAATLIVACGVAGLAIPVLPGAPLLFAGLLLAAWAENFTYIGVKTLAVLGVLALLTYVADFWATMFGAQRFGASKRAIIGALIGTVVGIFFGIPGIIFGPFIGAMIGELTARRGIHDAARAGIGATIGLVIGAALKIALAFTMLGLFAIVRFF
ncbi:MAG: DUF456 domain-containing protein [Deltaproteobacteria bacterium]|nr:DUF456 domain-containing protein [Deltaproteobacteria bacterium]